jgi:hypothetical protein
MGKRPTGFFVLCYKLGFETVLHIREFVLQLLPDLTKLLDLPPAALNFRLGTALLDDLQYVCQFGCNETTIN